MSMSMSLFGVLQTKEYSPEHYSMIVEAEYTVQYTPG